MISLGSRCFLLHSYRTILHMPRSKLFPSVLRRYTMTKANEKHFKKDIQRLAKLATPEKLKLSGSVCLLFVSSAVTMSVPFCMGKVIDLIFGSHDAHMIDTLRYVCLILSGVFLCGGLANAGRVYLINTSGQRIIFRLRKRVFSSIISQEMAFFDKSKTGELINRLSTDSTIVGQTITSNISDGLRASCQAIGGVGMMLYVSPGLAAKALIIVPPIAVAGVIYGRFVRRITSQVQDSLAASTQVAEERLSNIRTIRVFAQEDLEVDRYSAQIHNVLQLAYKEALARAVFFGSMGFSGNSMILVVLYFGGMMTLTSELSIGGLSAFIIYAITVGASMSGLAREHSIE